MLSISLLLCRCVNTGRWCVWHICVQLLHSVQPGRQTVAHLQRAHHRCPTQSQGQTSNQEKAISSTEFTLKAPYLTILLSVLQVDALPFSLQVFLGNHDDRGVAESKLDRIVSAQFVRLLPHDFQNGIYLRLEIMGCGDG